MTVIDANGMAELTLPTGDDSNTNPGASGNAAPEDGDGAAKDKSPSPKDSDDAKFARAPDPCIISKRKISTCTCPMLQCQTQNCPVQAS